MNVHPQRIMPGALILITLMLTSGFACTEAQQTPLSIRQRFAVTTANQRCLPAWLKTYSLGRQPPDAILAQVMIENLSDKTITAVKLGWKVYTQKEGLALPMAGCNAPTEAKVLLSGATPLVELGRLAPKQTGTISINPLPAPTTAGIITVFVDRPLLTVEDVRSLTDAPGGDANQYAAVMSITEIRFDDGTTWKAENN